MSRISNNSGVSSAFGTVIVRVAAITALGSWPAAWAAVDMGVTPVWFAAALIVYTLVALLALRLAGAALSRGSMIGLRSLLCVGASAYSLLNWLFAVSYYTQGFGFNDQLFFHLGTDTLHVGWQTERLKLLLQFSLLALLPLTVWWSSARAVPLGVLVGVRFRALASGLLISALVSTPTLNFISYLSLRQERSDLTAEAFSSYVPGDLNKARNIVLIYAESLEASYLDSEHFEGELLPQLKALSNEGAVFSDVRQRPGTGWTVAGLIASQCGFSVLVNNPFSGNTRLAATPKPYPEAECLGDIAQKLGYSTLFMGGAGSAFAGKGNFLRTHGFDRLLGRSELVAQSVEPLNLSPWGVHDDDLFARALAEIEALEAAGEPYFLSLLTLDTHHPEGFPSPRCKLAPGEASMRRSLRCSDQQIADFIRELRAREGGEDTLIAVFSDHLAMRNSLWESLRLKGRERRLLFMLLNSKQGAGQGGASVNTPLTHYEIGPTLLEAAGAASEVRIGFGESAFAAIAASDAGRDLRNLSIPRYAEPAGNLNFAKSHLAIDSSALVIKVGRREFAISENGGLFIHGAFTLIFNKTGEFEDVAYTRSLDDIGPSLRGKAVVIIERPTADSPLRYQVGRWGQSSMMKGELAQAEILTLEPETLRSLMK